MASTAACRRESGSSSRSPRRSCACQPRRHLGRRRAAGAASTAGTDRPAWERARPARPGARGPAASPPGWCRDAAADTRRPPGPRPSGSSTSSGPGTAWPAHDQAGGVAGPEVGARHAGRRAGQEHARPPVHERRSSPPDRRSPPGPAPRGCRAARRRPRPPVPGTGSPPPRRPARPKAPESRRRAGRRPAGRRRRRGFVAPSRPRNGIRQRLAHRRLPAGEVPPVLGADPPVQRPAAAPRG